MKFLAILGFIVGLLIGLALTKGHSPLIRIGAAIIGGALGAVVLPILVPVVMITIAVMIAIIALIFLIALVLVLAGVII